MNEADKHRTAKVINALIISIRECSPEDAFEALNAMPGYLTALKEEILDLRAELKNLKEEIGTIKQAKEQEPIRENIIRLAS